MMCLSLSHTSSARLQFSRPRVRSWDLRSSYCTTFMNACRRAWQFSLQKTMEQYRLFFLEDALSPENIDYFKQIRANCTTPIAMGELFNNPHEWNGLIRDSLIDFIRVHVKSGGRFNTLPKTGRHGGGISGADGLAWSR